MDEQLLDNNISKLLQRVRRAEQKSQFGNSDILALAASKTRPSGDLRAAYKYGLSAFGESYLQEALAKIDDLQDLDIEWHFIGPIQSNKTRAIAENFDWVHSVDRAKVATRLNDQRPPDLSPLNVCIQVNISQEASKSGISLDDVPALAMTVSGLPHLKLRGLMAVPQASDDERTQRAAFARLRLALVSLQTELPGLDTLSMGMSGDLEAAVGEGATIVRVGTAIFGHRKR